MRITLLALTPFFAIVVPAFAEPTRELSVSGSREVLDGDPETASIDAQGQISMGPTVVELGKASDRPITVMIAGPNNTVLAGTAGGAIVRIDAAGKAAQIAKAENEIVTALALAGPKIYAATSGGKIYSVDGAALKVTADPAAKYIWAMLPDGNDLLVATGEPGQILRIAANGTSKVMFDPGETHVRSLIRHPKRGLIAGGGQKGIIYQVAENGTAFALYDSEMEECTALAVDAASGDLYAALVSESKPGSLDPDKSIGAVAGDPPDSDTSPIKGSDLVRITPAGRVDLLWTSKREGALSLAFDPKSKRLYAATGAGAKGRGRVYAVDASDRDRLSLIARTEPPIASSILLAPTGGALIVGTAPAGHVLRIGPGLRSESTYVSGEQDLSRISKIGRVWFDADIPAGARVEVAFRTGNTKEYDKTWSAWSADVDLPPGKEISVPEGRYAQFRARLKASPQGKAPVLKSLHASVVRMNVAPTVQEVFLLRRGIYMSRMPPEEEKEKTVTLSRSTINGLRGPDDDDDARSVRVRQGVRPGMLTVSWRADDPNSDELIYRVEVLRLDDAQEAWQTVASDIKESFWSFDSRAYRDGRYRFRVTASDRPSNPPDQALWDRNISEPATIDNSAPKIRVVKATSPAAGRLRVEAEAGDDTSALGVAEMSLNGGPWLMLPASDGLLDAKDEKLSVEVSPSEAPGVPAVKTGRHSVLVRVEDEAGNESTASTTVTVR
jgi:sugar lactone lactonase YvrE